MNVHLPAKLTIEKFFSWAEDQEQRCELVGGVPKLLPYVKLNHSVISNNLVHQLLNQIDRKRFIVANGDFAVKTGPTSIRFADVMVMPAGKDGDILSVDDAVILFEVLSKSTMHQDFGAKKLEYQALESLQAYVVLAQDEPMIWLWQRNEDDEWADDPEQISEGNLDLAPIGVTLAMKEIYRSVK